MGASSTYKPLCAIAWGEADVFVVRSADGLQQIHGRAFALLPGGSMFNAAGIVHGIAGNFDDDPDLYILGDDDPGIELLLQHREEISDSLVAAEQFLPR